VQNCCPIWTRTRNLASKGRCVQAVYGGKIQVIPSFVPILCLNTMGQPEKTCQAPLNLLVRRRQLVRLLVIRVVIRDAIKQHAVIHRVPVFLAKVTSLFEHFCFAVPAQDKNTFSAGPASRMAFEAGQIMFEVFAEGTMTRRENASLCLSASFERGQKSRTTS
jgi:hypothetical protein